MNDAFGFVVAGPTTGKSSLLSKLTDSSKVIDTDNIIEENFPQFFRLRLWLSRDNHAQYAANVIAGQGFRIIALQRDVSLLTNLWSSEFLKAASFGKPGVFVFRESADEISRLSAHRGAKIPLKLAQKWVKSAREHASKVAHGVIFLPEGLYLGDVVSIVDGKFKLSEKGLELMGKGAQNE